MSVQTQTGKFGQSPFTDAVRASDSIELKKLIETGADLNAKDNYGMTPLHWAVQRNDIKFAELLIEAGADVNSKDINGKIPLHWATFKSFFDMERVLVDAGADLNALDNCGYTPNDRTAQIRYNPIIEKARGDGREIEDRIKSRALELLREQLQNPTLNFRDGQWQAIEALVRSQKRILVVQRTGWGKSSVYFIAAKIIRENQGGPTLIISPLLALMRNQVPAAKKLGVSLKTINSTNSEDWDNIENDLKSDRIDALIISPERLANNKFVEETLVNIASRVGLLVVDEAHCISDWGHDFRPDYKRLVNVLRNLPENMPVIATTATANDRVVRDIEAQLNQIEIQRGSLMRSSLALQNIELPSQAERLAWLADNIDSLPSSGIIYTLTTRDADQVAKWLRQNGIDAHAYYSNATNDEFEDPNDYRVHMETQLLENKVKALVATPALGMGFDKPDLGFVVHFQAPSSVVSYYQQVGRAGRAIDYAEGILLSGREDEQIHRHFRESAFPKEIWVQKLLKTLEDSSNGLTLPELEESLNLRHVQIERMLVYLSSCIPSPVLKTGSKWQRAAIEFEMDREQIKRLTEIRENEWEEVKNYITHNGCLMEFLANVLDDNDPTSCGKCKFCNQKEIRPTTVDSKMVEDAIQFLKKSEIPLNFRKRIPEGIFDEFKKRENKEKISEEYLAEEGRILSIMGDAGWGTIVEKNIHDKNISDELVGAVVEMVNRWNPKPRPEWISYVPPSVNEDLVKNFAKKLAEKLDLSFKPALSKVKKCEQQKSQLNSAHQSRNLVGVFEVSGDIPNSPVLLLDDIVDSGWTMTICAGLLREAGSGPVLPLALATYGGRR